VQVGARRLRAIGGDVRVRLRNGSFAMDARRMEVSADRRAAHHVTKRAGCSAYRLPLRESRQPLPQLGPGLARRAAYEDVGVIPRFLVPDTVPVGERSGQSAGREELPVSQTMDEQNTRGEKNQGTAGRRDPGQRILHGSFEPM